jgi:hypothetical protein
MRCTVGGVTRKNSWKSLPAGGGRCRVIIGVDERQVLALRRGERDRHALRSVIPCVAEGPRGTYDTPSNWTRASVDLRP